MKHEDPPTYVHRISRRAVLRGLGASLTLPFLPSLARAGDAVAGTSVAPPRRYAAIVFGNGVNVDHWWQKTDAAGRVTELGKSLAPLEPHLDDCLFLNNLHLFDEVSGIHFPYFTNFLVGKEIQRGPVPRLEQSLDHYLARAVGGATPVSCLTLGIEQPGFGMSPDGLPQISYGTISWSSTTTPVAPEIFPRQAFDRLFDKSSLVQDKSVLDFVVGQAKSVRSKLVAHDRDKLEEYLQSIREIERRIELATAENRFEGWRPSLDEPNMARPAEGTPQDVAEHMKLMLDILVLALQMDKTRVATLLLNRDTSSMRFSFLEGVSNSPLHQLSHHRSRQDVLDEYQLTNLFHVRQFAYLLDRMKAIDEGDGTTLLDNTALLFGSTMADGNIHDGDHLRLLVAGGTAMGIKGGRSVHYDKLDDRRLCNLHLDLARRMGVTERNEKGEVVPLGGFGNSHYPLPLVGS